MVFNLNSLACVWRTGPLFRGRPLGSLFSRCIITSKCFSTIPSSDQIKTPLLSSTAPCLLIPSPKDEVIAAAIANEVGKDSGEEENKEAARGFPDYCFYSLADRKIVSLNNVRSKSNIVIPDDAICVGSSHGWLAYVDPRDLAVFLTNPLVSPVPPTIRLPSLETLSPTLDTCFKKFRFPVIDKLVMSSAPSDGEDCTVMVIVNINGRNRLAFCKLGDSSWTAVENPRGCSDDLTYSSKDQLFYCKDYFSELVAWNLRNPHSPRRIDFKLGSVHGLPDYPELEKKLRDIKFDQTDYLVMDSCSGDVLLVSRYAAPIADNGNIIDRYNDDHVAKYGGDKFPAGTIRFDVYRLNASGRCWDYVADLGDGVMFLGLNQAFHLSAGDFAPGVLIPNSIYFTVDPGQIINDTGIYNMQDFNFTFLFPSHLHPFNMIHKPPPMWFTPNPLNS